MFLSHAMRAISRSFTRVPDAPIITSATRQTNNTDVILSFTTPENWGSQITTYNITSTPSLISTTVTPASYTGSLTLNGLNAATSYTFSVSATNGVGTSPSNTTSSISPLTLSASYFLVGGGGGGGNAGGGGGGGVQSGSTTLTFGSTYSVSIAGGGSYGANGGNSVFNSITAGGGGAGGTPNGNGNSGSNGGCGGGASYYTGGASPSGASGGTGYTNGGNSVYQSGSYLSPGGSYVSYTAAAGGGGGGAGGSGGSASVSTQTDNFGRLNGYSAGGGYGGSGISGSSWGLGTVAGGGGPNGAAGGSGSGSSNYGGGGSSSASGGPGVLVIKYADTYPAATSTTGSPTVSVSGGFRTSTFTSSGSVTF